MSYVRACDPGQCQWVRYQDICHCDICDGTPLGLLLECSWCGKSWRPDRSGRDKEWPIAWNKAPWPSEDDDD